MKGVHVFQIYVELDSGGWLTSAGGGGFGPGGGAAGPAALCVRARLAPHALCAAGLLALSAPGPADLLALSAPGPADLLALSAPSPADLPGPPTPTLAAPLLANAYFRLHVTEHLAPHAEFLLWFAEDVLAALDMPFLTPQNIRGRKDYACHKCDTVFEEPNPLKVHMFLSCAAYDPEQFWRRVVARLSDGKMAAGGALSAAALEALATEWGRAAGGHECVWCGKRYSRRYGLKIHVRTHTGYRPLRCRHCRRAFGDPSNLNKHERLHAARGSAPPGPYCCARCGRALARRRDLDRHLRTHADDGTGVTNETQR
ncbi:hypothetical protein HF086_016271 [Spodoptera exigua]|uniref:C2H2-type domain-containing protein n=1 Tax=Spodoptera exigua TaxID=7107 RepID=A0A922SNA4_SPOEX|nr:hypothetical protein HF086_016271 [Spodoptera exigua]